MEQFPADITIRYQNIRTRVLNHLNITEWPLKFHQDS